MGLISRKAAAVWESPIYWSQRVVTGMPKLHITVKPEQADTSLFVYLYDVDLLNVGQLISHKPYSLRDATPGGARAIDIRLEAQSWELKPGHRLALVIDTEDTRYADVSSLGGRVSFSSPVNDPSTLSVVLQ